MSKCVVCWENDLTPDDGVTVAVTLEDGTEYTEFICNDCLVACPDCGHKDSIQGFDVVGADPGHVFCTQCHKGFQP
jgi:hypothetical protein